MISEEKLYEHIDIAAVKKIQEHKEELFNHPDFKPEFLTSLLDQLIGDGRLDMQRIEEFHLHLLAAVNVFSLMMGLNVTSLAEFTEKQKMITTELLDALYEAS